MSSLRARPRVVEVETTTTHEDAADRRPLPGSDAATPGHLLHFDFHRASPSASRPSARAPGRAVRDTSIKDAIIKFLEQKI